MRRLNAILFLLLMLIVSACGKSGHTPGPDEGGDGTTSEVAPIAGSEENTSDPSANPTPTVATTPTVAPTPTPTPSLQIPAGAAFTEELILSIQDDLQKISGVLDDITNFNPLEKTIDVLSNSNRVNALPKFDDPGNGSEPTQRFYKMVKVNNSSFTLSVETFTLANSQSQGSVDYQFSSQPRRYMQTKEGTLFVLLKNNDIYRVAAPPVQVGSSSVGNAVKVQVSNDHICLKHNNESKVSFVSSSTVVTKTYTGSTNKYNCIDNKAFMLLTNSVEVLSSNAANVLVDTSSCNQRKVYVRNNNYYISCKPAGQSRKYYLYTDLNQEVALPANQNPNHNKYTVKLDKKDVASTVTQTKAYVRDNDTDIITDLDVNLLFLAPQKLDHMTSNEEHIFRGSKDLYHFDSEFNLTKKVETPFRPVLTTNEKIYNNKLERFFLEQTFAYKNYLFGGKNYLNTYKEYSPTEVVNIKAQKVIGNKLYYRNGNDFFRIDSTDGTKESVFTISSGEKVAYSPEAIIRYKYDNPTQTFDVIIQTKSNQYTHSFGGLGNKAVWTVAREVIAAYDGNNIHFYKLDDASSLGSVGLKHYRYGLGLESGYFLAVTKSNILVNNKEQVDLYLIRSPSDTPELLDTVTMNYKDIQSVQLVGNFVVFYK